MNGKAAASAIDENQGPLVSLSQWTDEIRPKENR